MPIQYPKVFKIYSESGKISEDILIGLIKMDPFSKGTEDEIKIVGPYANWIIKRYLSEGQFSDIYMSKSDNSDTFLTECLRKFDFLKKREEYKGERDIGKIKSIDTLYNEIKDYEVDEELLWKRYGWIKREKPNSKNIVFEDDRFLVAKIESMEEAFYYGTKTKWCITKGSYDDAPDQLEDNSLYKFLKYGARIFIIIDKLAKRLDPYSKIVLHIAPFTHTTNEFTNIHNGDYNDMCNVCGKYVPSDGFWDRWDNEPPVKQLDGSIKYTGHVGCSYVHPSDLDELNDIGWPDEFVENIIFNKCVYPSMFEIEKEIVDLYLKKSVN